jgi:hypothetical protein
LEVERGVALGVGLAARLERLRLALRVVERDLAADADARHGALRERVQGAHARAQKLPLVDAA